MGGRHDSTCLSMQCKFGLDALSTFDNVSAQNGFFSEVAEFIHSLNCRVRKCTHANCFKKPENSFHFWRVSSI